jgi:hypothetical protein
MDGVDTPSKPEAVADDEQGIRDIAAKNGDLILQIEHNNTSLKTRIHSFRVATAAL